MNNRDAKKFAGKIACRMAGHKWVVIRKHSTVSSSTFKFKCYFCNKRESEITDNETGLTIRHDGSKKWRVFP